MKKFQHGGDIEAFAKELKCHKKEIIDLSSNINFLKPKINLDLNSIDISPYPNYDNLYKQIAKNYKVKASQIELYNGGSSAIFNLFATLELKECSIYSPAYLEYKKACEIFSYKLSSINRLKKINEEVKENSLVVFVNPSTPDGKYYNLKKLFKQWIEKNCTILIDESFLDFTKNQSAIKYLKEYDKLYILKSMTKFYANAGVRVGTLISSKKNIKKLKESQAMWKISCFDMHYILEALKDKDFRKKSLKENIKNRITLYELLKQYSFIKKVFKSNANFLLLELKDISANSFQEKLKPYKIMIRDCSNFDYLNSNFVRIAVKDKNSIKVLKKALDNMKV